MKGGEDAKHVDEHICMIKGTNRMWWADSSSDIYRPFWRFIPKYATKWPLHFPEYIIPLPSLLHRSPKKKLPPPTHTDTPINNIDQYHLETNVTSSIGHMVWFSGSFQVPKCGTGVVLSYTAHNCWTLFSCLSKFNTQNKNSWRW